ncbi:MAG: hypothetical protein AAB465_02425 [Patescibacteria group bacterium]
MPEEQLDNNFQNEGSSNNLDRDSENGGTIYAMPSKFRGAKFKAQPVAPVPESETKEKIKLKFININVKFLVIILGVGAVVAAAIFGFVYWSKNYLNKGQGVAPADLDGASSQTTALTNPLVLTYEIKNETTGQIISRAKIDFPAGALVENVSCQLAKANSLPAEFVDYLVVGGVYQILPDVPTINKNVVISITYNKDLVNPQWEKFINIGYHKNSIWTTIPESRFDTLTTTISANLPVIPSNIFALIVDKNKINLAVPEVIIGQRVGSTLDSDQDNLTDTEEQLYQTGPNNPDSNSNGILDGDEVATLKNPLIVNQDLVASGIVNSYSNPTWSYSLLYPSSWLVKPMPETDLSQVIIVTDTSEFFEASVEKNSDRLSPKAWYLKQSPDAEADKIREVLIESQPAVWDINSLNLFISKADDIYILTYNLGTESAANFKTTFKMIIKSFKFMGAPISEITPPVNSTTTPPVGEEIFPPPARPDGALIKYEDREDVYLIEGGKKRPIFSKQVFNQRNFRWEDVVIVPDSEIYQTGDMIN